VSHTLLAAGGAVDPAGPIMKTFLRLSGGPEARIAILATASVLKDAGGAQARALAELGLKHPARILAVRDRTAANDPETARAIRNSTGIFICGGNQVRLSSLVGGTELHRALLDSHRRGVVIAGTSAGAACMSATMIGYGTDGQAPRRGSAHLMAGLGFRPDVLIDQHFSQRNRMGRMLASISANPDLLGLGIDENTAALIEADALSVLGANGVFVLDGRSISTTNVAEVKGRELVAISGMTIHVLTAGCQFDLTRRTAVLPAIPLEAGG
jgi:cyanophycinase